MQKLSEAVVEDAALEWFEGLGYSIAHGPDIAPDANGIERTTYADALLPKLLSGEVRVESALDAIPLAETAT